MNAAKKNAILELEQEESLKVRIGYEDFTIWHYELVSSDFPNGKIAWEVISYGKSCIFDSAKELIQWLDKQARRIHASNTLARHYSL